MSRRAERGVVMETAPSAPFEVIEPDLAFQFLVVALDALLSLTLIRRGAFALFRDDRGLGSHTARHGRSRFNVGVVREGIASAMPSLRS